MPGRLPKWTALVGGLVATAGLIVVGIGVLFFARVGALRGDTYRLFTYTDEARGILKGSDVWLAGQKVGSVAGIEFRPVEADTSRRIRLTLDILREHGDHFRGDSYAQIRSGGNLIGSPVVYVVPGTPAAPPLTAGSLIPSRGQLDSETLTSEFAIASRQFPEIIANVRTINAEMRGVRAALGGTGSDAPAVAVHVVGGRVLGLGKRALSGSGTIGSFVNDEDRVFERAQRAISRADSLRQLLDTGRGTFVRLRGDTTLLRTLADARNEVSIVRALLAEPGGSAGRFLRDSAIVRQLGRIERELGLTMEDFKRDPARYIAF